jgi:small ligand-binding sensory domain FIST
MSSEEQLWARENTFVCLVHDEYNANSRAGDFFVRNLAAIDPKTGNVAIAVLLCVG